MEVLLGLISFESLSDSLQLVLIVDWLCFEDLLIWKLEITSGKYFWLSVSQREGPRRGHKVILIDRGRCQRTIYEVWKIYLLNAEDRVCQINKNPKIRRIWGFLFILQTLSEAWSRYIFQTEDIVRGRRPLYFIHHASLNLVTCWISNHFQHLCQCPCFSWKL